MIGIELMLDEALVQRYAVAVRVGVRYAFIEAGAAARNTFQRAIAERYLLLTLLCAKRFDLIPTSLGRLEGLAMSAALEAMVMTDENREAATALMRRTGVTSGLFGNSARLRTAQLQVKSAALQMLNLSGRLLGEAALLGSESRREPRVSPAEWSTLIATTREPL